MTRLVPSTFLGVLILLSTAAAQVLTPSPAPVIPLPEPIIIVPPRRVIPPRPGQTVAITRVDADIRIVEQAATTRLVVHLSNPTPRRQEAVVLLPVPTGATVRQFSFLGSGKEDTAELLRREDARRIYEQIVAQTRDPALLEFIDCALLRSSVFPVEPHGTQEVRLTYEALLPADGRRLDYLLPRSEAIDYQVPWSVKIDVRSKQTIASLYSPSHELDIRRQTSNHIVATLTANAERQPGSLRLSVLRQGGGDEAPASVFAYPDPRSGGGYFLLLVALPPIPQDDAGQREITLVLDRSGSMAGTKLRQVREAARQIIAGLGDGEAFQIITYNESVERFADRPVIKSRQTEKQAMDFLDELTARGGTNIHDALVEALHPRPTDDMLPLVLFLTDGMPTVGPTSEAVIRDLAAKGNRHQRRVFTFGVGADLNAPLLNHVADLTRARATFVLPDEDIELAVAGLFKRLHHPVFTDGQLTSRDGRRLGDLMPRPLPDLFADDQMVIVGRYRGDEPIEMELAGETRGKPRRFTVAFDPQVATTQHAFVGRLWAGRRIATLIDSIRDLGADPSAGVTPSDPRVKELVDEVVRLSLEFGILTPYTAFLAREGTELAQREQVRRMAEAEVAVPALSLRAGAGAVALDAANSAMKAAARTQPVNRFKVVANDRFEAREIQTVQQVAGQAMYRRGNQWVDNNLVQQADAARNARVVEIGSRAYWQVVDRLASQGRQALVSFKGELLVQVDGEPVLIR